MKVQHSLDFFKYEDVPILDTPFRRLSLSPSAALAARLYSGKSRTVAERAAWAPITRTWAMSAVFDGPLMNVP